MRKRIFKFLWMSSLIMPSYGLFVSFKPEQAPKITNVSIAENSLTIGEFINHVEGQTDYLFVYSKNEIDLNQVVSVQSGEKSIEKCLDEAFNGSGVSYAIRNDNVILSKAPAATKTQQQAKKISGTITDKSGEPIIGANVTVKGTTNGTTSDFDGKYTLDAAPGNILVVSYIGYTSKEVPVGNQSSLNIVLSENTQALEEVVVVGYGTQKKVNLSGAVATVNTELIKDRVQTNVLSAVQGTVPGVTIISRPGQSPSINFRGRGNLGTSEPLYVIDGAIADASFFSNLDPNSIESISFLKDAASSSIYGARAAYGVVLVTTKSGKKDKFNISYSGNVSINNPTYTNQYVSSADYAVLYNESLYNSNPALGKHQAFSEEEIGWFRDGSKPDLYPNTNWEDLIFDKNYVSTQHSLNFSGGNERIRFFTGLGYSYNDNIIPGRDNDRYNLNTNLTADITDWFTLKTAIKFIRNQGDVSCGTPSLGNFVIVPSTFVAKQSNGEWGSINAGKTGSATFIGGNPLRALDKNDWSKSKTDNTMLDLGFDIKPVKGLVISGQGVYKGYEYKYKSYTALQDNVTDFLTGSEIAGTGTTKNSMSMDWRSTDRLLLTGTIRYDWSNDLHDVQGLVGTSYEKYNYQRMTASRENFPADSFEDLTAGSATGAGYKNGGGMTDNKMFSYFARVNYSFMSRYLLEANFRADASSRFHKDHRWGYFPSFSGAWRINEESFLRDYTWLDNLKLRASYGTLGNINNVGDYDYFENYSANAYYPFDDTSNIGIQESKPANKKLGWEKVSMTNFGIDADLWNGKLSVVAEYYIKNTNDILLGYNVPVETGISQVPSQNIGKVKNNGFEFSLNHRNTVQGFTYSIGGNLSLNKNEIKNLSSSDKIIQSSGHIIKYILEKGESVGSFFGYKTDGLYTQEDIDAGRYYKLGGVTPNAGDIKFLPQRDGVEYKQEITAEDRTIIGCDVPKFTYGVNLNLMYKNFELAVFGQGVGGTKVAFDVYGIHPFFHGMDNPREFHLNRWTEENPNQYAIYPRIYSASDKHTTYNRNFNDQHLFDADYFRFKTITLGYVVPQKVIQKAGFDALKVYVTGENLFTIRADHKMKDFDPESAGSVIYNLGTKSVAFGINLTF